MCSVIRDKYNWDPVELLVEQMLKTSSTFPLKNAFSVPLLEVFMNERGAFVNQLFTIEQDCIKVEKQKLSHLVNNLFVEQILKTFTISIKK